MEYQRELCEGMKVHLCPCHPKKDSSTCTCGHAGVDLATNWSKNLVRVMLVEECGTSTSILNSIPIWASNSEYWNREISLWVWHVCRATAQHVRINWTELWLLIKLFGSLVIKRLHSSSVSGGFRNAKTSSAAMDVALRSTCNES